MKKSMRRLSLALLITVGPALAGVLYYMLTRPLPKPITIALQIPERAEVRPASTVSPGTFKIEVSLSELLERAKTSGAPPALVSWGNDVGSIWEMLRIEYWLPRGDSTFFHATLLHRIHWPMGVGTYTLERTPEEIMAIPQHGDGWMAAVIVGLVVCIVVGVLLVMGYYGQRRVTHAAAT